MSDRATLIAALRAVIDDTEAEYAQMPFFVRPMVKRGFVQRTGHDLTAWRRLLDEAARGAELPTLATDLGKLADHYLGAPARAQRGMGASAAQLREVERRSAARAAAAQALRDALASS
jgi:hypothetical protein